MQHDAFQPTPAPPPSLPRKRKPEPDEWPMPDIAPGFQKVSGKRSPPRGEQRYWCQFRCGFVDERVSYTAAQLRWKHIGDDWDVVAVKRA